MDPLATFTGPELQRMTDRAYREAARSWSEYRTADAQRDTSDDARALAQLMHDAAWSAENHWRGLYDACKARGVSPVVAPETETETRAAWGDR